MSTKGKAARTATPGTASKTAHPHFTAAHRAWVAIVPVAQRYAIDALLLASFIHLLLALVAAWGVLV